MHRTQQATGAERDRLLVELRQALERRFDQAVQERREEIDFYLQKSRNYDVRLMKQWQIERL